MTVSARVSAPRPPSKQVVWRKALRGVIRVLTTCSRPYCFFAELKELNTWPTFPQLIIKGEFVGGLDVVQEMVEAGELKEMLA